MKIINRVDDRNDGIFHSEARQTFPVCSIKLFKFCESQPRLRSIKNWSWSLNDSRGVNEEEPETVAKTLRDARRKEINREDVGDTELTRVFASL